MRYTVREARDTDVYGIGALERECFSLPWSENALTDTMREPSSVFFVCEGECGCTLGYIGGVCALDECSVTNVCVTQSARRQCIGNALMDAFEAACIERGVSVAFLEVRVSNIAAIGAYEKRGYERCGVRKGFYSKPTEDAFVYKKTLL